MKTDIPNKDFARRTRLEIVNSKFAYFSRAQIFQLFLPRAHICLHTLFPLSHNAIVQPRYI